MAYDKIVDSGALETSLTAIADAIRGKTGGTDALTLEQMATAIAGIETDGGGITPSGSIDISTNGTYDVTEYAEAVVNVASSGGASVIYSGSFTPAENLLSVTVDIGGSFTHFVCYAVGIVTGYGIKATAGLIADVETPYLWGMATNNSGSSLSVVLAASIITSSGTHSFFQVNNTQIQLKEDHVIISTSSPSGACFGYFIAGVTYLWYAW